MVIEEWRNDRLKAGIGNANVKGFVKYGFGQNGKLNLERVLRSRA